MSAAERQIMIRVNESLKLAVVSAAEEIDISMNQWMIQAIREKLGAGDNATASGNADKTDSALADKVRELEARVLALEASRMSARTKLPSQDAPQPASKTSQVSQHPKKVAPKPPGVETLGDAQLRRHHKAAGSELSFFDWASQQGWQRQGKGNTAKWFKG